MFIPAGGDNRERPRGAGVRDGAVVGDPDVPRQGAHGGPQPRHPAVQGQAAPRRRHSHPAAGKKFILIHCHCMCSIGPPDVSAEQFDETKLLL